MNPVDIDNARKARNWEAPNKGYVSAKLKTFDALSLSGKTPEPMRWVVDGWIPFHSTTLLYGDGGLGKSLLALQLAAACSTGGRWLGMDAMACKVLVISCEDGATEIHRRMEKVNAQLGITFDDLENLRFSDCVHGENALMTYTKFDEEPPKASEFFQQIHDCASDFGAQLVVIDSLHDVFDGNEINRSHARKFIKLLTSLASDIDGSVLVCCHPSSDGMKTGKGTSGSTAWSNASRSRLYLRRPEDKDQDSEVEDVRVLRRMKSNYARSGDEIMVRWTDGAFRREDEPTGVLKVISDRRAEGVFLACLDALTAQCRAITHAKNQPHYAPRVMASLPQAEGIKARDFASAMDRLFASNLIANGVPFLRPNRHPAMGIVRVGKIEVETL